MKKYKVYRSFGKIEDQIKKHELVAIESGKDIYDATDRLIKAVCDDAAGLEKYQKGFSAYAYAPKPVEEFQKVKRYEYYLTAVLSPDFGEENDLIEYGVIEEDE